MASILGFVIDNLLFIVTGLFGAAGLLILALVRLGVLPGRELLPLPGARGTPGTELDPPTPPKA